MSVPCHTTEPHRPHPADNAHGICAGVPKPEDKLRAEQMIREAWQAATERCIGRATPCFGCLTEKLIDLSVFEPVLFPEETQ